MAIGCFAAGTIAGVLLWWLLQPPPKSACERAVRGGDYRRGVGVCLASHVRTGSARDLSWVAQAFMYWGDGKLEVAGEFAEELLERWPGEGHRILSFVRFRQGRGHAARDHARLAILAHRIFGDESALTSDHLMLAQAAWKLGDFTASLDAADEALRLARRLRSTRNEVAAQLARADALRRMGDTRGATGALEEAARRATEPCDVAWTHLKKGMLHMEAGPEGFAWSELEAAAKANARCGSPQVSTSITHNQAWLLRWKDPAGALARLDDLAKAQGDVVEALLLRGYLAADRGALAEAEGYLAEAARMDPPDADWPWVIARARAELSEQRGGMFGDLRAEHHYRQATAMIAALRGGARARSAFLVSSHRGPYDGLLGLLARRGRWRDALAVILELDASDMLRATATAAAAATHDPTPLPPSAPASAADAPPPPAVEDVLAAWRSRDLVIVIAPSRRRIGPGRERAYRLRIAHGEVTGEDVGDAGAAQAWADALFADPGAGEAARALGRMIVPPAQTDELLHVLAIGPLGKIPLAALRDAEGAPILAGRPLARVFALHATGPESGGASPPVVIADPRGDLPGARMEGAVVAAAVGPAARVSGSAAPLRATRDRLWEARDAELLHLAAHVIGHRRALRLADGDVEPAELVRARLAPRLAVLASCGSAAATDEEGWGSIATALLVSGAATVLATDRSVDDAASLSIMRGFYAQPDWRADPARALARVQQALDARAPTPAARAAAARSWARFSVLRRPPVVPAR